MTQKPQKREEKIFYQVLEAPPSQRETCLKEACGDDQKLFNRVEALLQANDLQDSFLHNPVLDSQLTLETLPNMESVGTTIGLYKLLEKIGEGGMAVVYMAEQEEPIRRKVALKIIKLGMDTKSVIARFELERQALAMMDHPNIAKVLDAGATETGRPFFVMELVKGASITEFCDANNLTTKDRLELFIQVCQAVKHAHQKGIIHRDIKPTNVMVTLHDGVPVPKVIDFGIAKAINQKLTEKTLFTRYAHIIGTPAYMSPEQAELSDLGIDSRSDIYSLGVLLYELLTGTTPFSEEELRKAGYIEMQRIILEEEPARPSTKVSTLGQVRIDVAKYRNTNPNTLEKLIRADLDWIVMRTLEKDRDRRYDSVSEFTSDIKRYLNNEPVLAGPPNALYRIKKFVQRRRVLVAATAVVAASLIMGFMISTSLYLRMRQALHTVSQLEDKVEIYNQLATVQRLYAEGRHQAALDEIEATLNEQNLGPKAQLLRARLLVEVGQLKNAEAQLLPLTKAEPDISGAAHYLLARVNIGVDAAKVEEHEALAASILPETAEAYALRAMTATSTDQALQWLDRAITLDPTHYPSLKARVLIQFTRGEDEKMIEDVAALIALRPRDFLGYAIRAILRRESGRFEEAVADHARAIELCESDTELVEVYDQRYETYTKMGNHSAALEDARYLAESYPQECTYRFRIFASLIALKSFVAAQQEYRAITQTSYQWDKSMRRYLASYVFDILDAGQTLALPPDIVQRAPFAEMKRVADCYHILASKATPLPMPRQGGVPYAWSPDGKQLLCGWAGIYGALGRTIIGAVPTVADAPGLKIVDIESGKEQLVAKTFGGIPSWSPDGKYIAYPDRDRNLYIVPREGGQPRKLASGFCPQWSQDSQRLYYWTEGAESEICSINIYDPCPIPQTLIKAQGRFVISEEDNWIAFAGNTKISLVDLSSGSLLNQYAPPWTLGGWRLSLLPHSRELCLTSRYSNIDAGPFIVDTRNERLYRVLNHPVDRVVWSPDGSKLAIGATRDIWIMDADPNFPTFQDLGEPSSEADLINDEIKKKSQAIANDPLYPENYLRRAVDYMSLNQYQEAQSDLEQFDALVTSDDHHVGFEIFWWLRQCYDGQLDKEAELLAHYAEKLMDRFPADVPSYRDLIIAIAKRNEKNGKPELARRWRMKLQETQRVGP